MDASPPGQADSPHVWMWEDGYGDKLEMVRLDGGGAVVRITPTGMDAMEAVYVELEPEQVRGLRAALGVISKGEAS